MEHQFKIEWIYYVLEKIRFFREATENLFRMLEVSCKVEMRKKHKRYQMTDKPVNKSNIEFGFSDYEEPVNRP